MNLKHPFWQGVLVLVLAYVVIKWGIGYLLPMIGVPSAPVPSTVVTQYMLTVLVGVLLYMSAESDRWAAFKAPMVRTMVDPGRRALRGILLVGLPLLVGWVAYQGVKPSFGAPATLRSIHPAPPNSITFRGATMELAGLENPLRHSGDMEAHLAVGNAVYTRNCVPCHGDLLDGQGHFASMLTPVPADFTNTGTIVQLTESYVFWRIAKGGPGLPNEGAPWNSAMPAWETILDENETWSVILFLYERTGSTPRTWEEEGAEGEAH
ncbi:MAG: c-type cytochrome [Gemmatimonadota bacterium]|nr:c-type cytochrome [Gemmatimonadota bacterium]